jgi:hypothetical protein
MGLLAGHIEAFDQPMKYASALLQFLMQDLANVWVAVTDDASQLLAIALIFIGDRSDIVPTIKLGYLVSGGENSLEVYQGLFKAIQEHYESLGFVQMETMVDTDAKKQLALGCGARVVEVAQWRL